MFLNNKIMFWVIIVFNDLYVNKNKTKLCGVTPPIPILWRQSRQTLPRSNIEYTYVQVHSSPSREFVRFEKVFFLHFSGNVDQVYCCWSVCQVVRSDVFSSAVQQTLRAVVLRECGIHFTFWHEEKNYFLKHDAIPTIFFQLVGKWKKIPERRNETEGAFAKRETKSGIVSTLRACF